MEQLEYIVPDYAEQVRPLLIGAQMPDAALRTMDGDAISLHAVLAGEATVLFFYRGHW